MATRRAAPRDATLTVSGLYLRQVADQVRRLGGDVTAWLAGCGLDEGKLADADLTLSLPQLERLIEGALATTREPALGLVVGGRLVATAHGVLSYAALASSTLRQALELVERYVPLRLSLLSVMLDERPREVRIVCRAAAPLGDFQRTLSEIVVSAVKNVFDALSLGASGVTRVCFDFPAPAYAPLARDLLRCEVRYGQPFTGLVLPRLALDRPLPLADPAAFEQAAIICQRELDKLTESRTVASSVRRLLLEPASGFLGLEATARRLRMTPRTLHRRLVDEGTTFHAIVESVRHTLATEHLASGRSSIKQIAYALGYTDLANFRRAFRRWEGVPPSEWKRGG